MKQSHLKLLGAKVLPIVKRSSYGAQDWDSVGNLNFLAGEEKRKYAKRVVDDATRK